MANLVLQLEESIRVLNAQKEEVRQEREQLEDRLRELDKLLDAALMLMRWESERQGTPVPEAVNGSGKWTGIPLRVAVSQVLEQHPQWLDYQRKRVYRNVLSYLLENDYDFDGKKPSLAVNIALTRVWPQKEGTESKNDGEPPMES